MTDDRALLTRLFEAAVAAADPARALRPHLPRPPRGRTVVVGAGKGAAQMAAAFETLWDGPCEGVVVTRYGYACPTRAIRVLEAAHPVPDAAGMKAAQALFDAVQGLGPDDLVVALICGGGSALLPAPPDGLTLEDEQALNETLLRSGAPIGAMNAIRKQVSRLKGGRLAAAAHPAQVVSLIVSDVPGDDPAQVASGPTVPDTANRDSARAALRDYSIALPDRLAKFIAESPEDAPQPDDPAFARDRVTVIASAAQSLEAAALAADHGLAAHILSDAIEGEAREVARVHAAIAKEVARKGRPFARPALILSGGETTVTLRGNGRGGRNTEFLLAFAMAIEGCDGLTALAADTDGIDGSEDNAGAFADGRTAADMRAAGIDPAQALADNDAYSAFAAIGALFAPGPTGTNVNDFRAILVR
ncbi:glycerate kinase [Lutimaribacter sp. EGI FJ00015]|uniref:Glycerate kinase n=1 Tax=Lutimaribacter degradans TaxID=2945989 RepID=A0ACC5ZYY6_9RHOB|nr:glycerate kinase [Lutimaribacter sp. EGI FJ00013]MCM2563045.1 glycerate kinase [Lutimaribacter sp. EGI FJ00013]MCO0614224.1 glycerate kinase [Lutimaribacter sp. EGI FJ00015]MCO0637034.1 glycerate kinase [Lutimaribacter sp. EGI FJ00014]